VSSAPSSVATDTRTQARRRKRLPFGDTTRALLQAAGFTSARTAGSVSVTTRPPSWHVQPWVVGTEATWTSFTKRFSVCAPGAVQSV
jgi:hypothetical protein